MAKKQRVKGMLISMFNVPQWLGLDLLRRQGAGLRRGVSRLFVPDHAIKSEEFDEVVERFNLTESQLAMRMRECYRMSVFLFLLVFPILAYAVYLLFWRSWYAGLLGIVVAGLPAVLSFRYHFWYYQMKQRRLGVTFSEWLHSGFLGDK